MAKTVSDGFQIFLAKIQPLESERAKAVKHKGSVKSSLEKNLDCYQFTETGSFGNGTGVRHHSDTDYFASMPSKNLSNDSAYYLRKVKNTLRGTFWNTGGIEINSPAVVIPFGQYASENLEITPCGFMGMTNTPLGNYPRYTIPDSNGGWMYSSPQAHNAYVKSIDEKLKGKLKPIIKFIKAWKFMQGVPIVSFYLEIRITKFFETSIVLSYDEAICDILTHLYNIDLAGIRDPMGVSGLIPSTKTAAQKATALSKLTTALSRAEKAHAARSRGNIDEAFRYWKLFYNDEFPSR